MTGIITEKGFFIEMEGLLRKHPAEPAPYSGALPSGNPSSAADPDGTKDRIGCYTKVQAPPPPARVAPRRAWRHGPLQPALLSRPGRPACTTRSCGFTPARPYHFPKPYATPLAPSPPQALLDGGALAGEGHAVCDAGVQGARQGRLGKPIPHPQAHAPSSTLWILRTLSLCQEAAAAYRSSSRP
jgi:hypothetical protein